MESCANNNTESDNKKLYLPHLSKETTANSNESILSTRLGKKDNDEDVIPLVTMLDYNTIGFKLVPLGVDSKTPAIKSTTEIYSDCAYWNTELIKEEHHRFKNIATTFGMTYINDENGEYLYLHGLDIDSDNVLRILSDLLEELKSKTYVTKTKKGCGYHLYWLSHKQNPAISISKCKTGYEFEIKTDNSLGLFNLPPSRHRDDPDFRYQSIGQKDKIVTDDTLYDKIVNLLSNQCLVNSRSNGKSNGHIDSSNGKASKSDSIYTVLEDTEIEDIVSCIKGSYIKGYRHSLAFGLSGLLFKNNISLSSAEKLVSSLCDYTCDEEKASRLSVVNNTYLKGLEGHEIKGRSQLEEVFVRIHNTGNSDDSSSQNHESIEVLKKLDVALKKTHEDKEEEEKNDGKKGSTSPTKIIVQLVEENSILFFKDQYDIAYAKVKVADHSEIIALGGSRFEYYLSKLYYDYSEGEAIVGQEPLNNAIRILMAKTLFEGSIVNLSLRISWGEYEREIYYDLADSRWCCIKVTEHGWEIIQDSPVLFIRFNQKAQVEPDRNYPNDIFEKYLNLMHINTSDHRLLIKAWTVAAFIPNIPHPISIPYGEKGSVKTTYCKFQKRLIDPDKIELLTVPQEKSEFVQQQYHNYLTIYDNIKTIPYWFSDEVCKAVTGIGSSKRRLYTDDEDVIYSYKRLIIINGINNSLTEPDALDRSILKEFERIPDDQRKEESKVEAEFEEMKPKLLGYVFDILVKSLQIKPTIQLHNLPRMADFAVWGESITRAMGYMPMEFIEAYYRNISRQNVEVIESNRLAQATEKFVYSWYKEGQEACWQSSTSKVLEKLNNVAQVHGIDTNSKSWPKAANSLTKRLRPILSNLREGLGIYIIISRNTSGKNKNISTIRIWKEPPLPPPSPLDQNQAQNQGKSGGDILDGGDNTSTLHSIPPLENGQTCAQITNSGDSGDSGDIFPNPTDEQHMPSFNGTTTTALLSSSNCISLQNRNPVTGTINPFVNYVAIDFEWLTYDSDEKSIYAASFVDTTGKVKVLHVSDFNSEQDLLNAIKQELTQYTTSIGWNTTGIDSDLAIMNERCIKNGIQSIVEYNEKGVPFVEGHIHIDLYKVFRNEMIKTSIFKNRYKSLKLDEVSRAILGKGKITGTTGENVYTKSIEEQKQYVLRDAELVMDLSKVGNGEVLDLMSTIAGLTGLSLEEVCHTSISRWWAKVFEDMGLLVSSPSTSNNHEDVQNKQQCNYEGGKVIEPKKGVYHDLRVVDVVSLYPSMAILHNISFDTVNCECCSDILDAKVPSEVLDKGYWICKQREGAFPMKLKQFKAERIRQKQEGNNTRQQGLKILINGGYGLFANPAFKYYDIRVAELITAYGRHTLNQMQLLASSNGFDIVGGDTDSLFLQTNNKDILKFISECKQRLNIEVEHDKTFTKAIITKKKHYIGVTDKGEIIIKGMEGNKNDRPPWINNTFNQFVEEVIRDQTDPLTSLRNSVKALEEGKVNANELQISIKLSKNPDQYSVNNIQKKLGVKLNLKAGDVIQYYKSDNKGGVSLNPNDISIKKYKAMLWNSVKDILEVAGYDVAIIEREFVRNNSNKLSNVQRHTEVANM